MKDGRGCRGGASLPSDGQRRRGGFTLLEVMIALVVMGFGLLTLATMQIHALKQGSAGRHTGDASAVARSYLEQMQRVSWAELTNALAAGAGAETNVFWTNQGNQVTTGIDRPDGGAQSIEETYNVTWTVTDVSACVRDIEVNVRWQEENMSTPKRMRLATRRYNWGGAGC